MLDPGGHAMALSVVDPEFRRLLGRLPAECPMSYDQAHPALLLGDVLRVHAQRQGLRWHVGANDPVDYLLPDGRPKRAFPDMYVLTDFVRPTGAWHLCTWVHDRAPDFILEVLVPGSAKRDMEEKRTLYLDDLGVREYFVFDVHGVRISGQVIAWSRREGGGSDPILPMETGGGRRWPSRVLGLELELTSSAPGSVVPWELRAYVPGSTSALPTPTELVERARFEAERAKLVEDLEAERERVRALESRLREAEEGDTR